MEARVARLVHNVDIGVRSHDSEELASHFGVPVGAGDVQREHRLRARPVRRAASSVMSSSGRCN